MSLQLLASGSIAANATWDDSTIGGLSGIDYDAVRDEYRLITDDRGANQGTRIFAARIARSTDESLAVTLTSAERMRIAVAQADGRTVIRAGVDAEALRMLPGRRILWASEGDASVGIGPGVFEADEHASIGQPLALPANLMPDVSGHSGPRPNRSFEGLTTRPGSDSIFLALEAPLFEDGELPTVRQGARTAIYELDPGGAMRARYSYPLGPIATQSRGMMADNGVSEVLAFGERQFLVLERSGSEQQDGSFRYVTRLYCAWPEKPQRHGALGIRLGKRLVADFNRLGSFELANFEGMTFGPMQADGRRSLVLVADNDFRPDRPTILAMFGLQFDRPGRR